MMIRDAVEEDMGMVTEIYNDAVANTTAIWNETTVDVGNRVAWLQDRRAARFPVLVAVDGSERVLGYASFGSWRRWEGYRHTVEHSVYVHRDERGKSIGKALLEILIERARVAGLHVMIAGIEAGNVPSIRLHEKLGFRQVGHLEQVGAKFGKWLNLVFLQLTLDERAPPGEG